MIVTGRLDQRSWETQEGDKRSKVEITADEIAPSLRWATVHVTRNERRTPESSNGDTHAVHEPALPTACWRSGARSELQRWPRG